MTILFVFGTLFFIVMFVLTANDSPKEESIGAHAFKFCIFFVAPFIGLIFVYYTVMKFIFE